MTGLSLRTVLLVWGLCLWPAVVLGAGLRDLSEAWLIDWPDALALVQGPSAADSLSTDWWLQVGTGRLFQMPELPQQRLETGVGFHLGGVRLGLGLGWETLGESLYRENQTDRWLSLGDTWRVVLTDEQALRSVAGVSMPDSRRLSLQAGGPLTRGPAWAVRVDCRLLSVDLGKGSDDPPRRGLARLTLTHYHLGVAVALDRDRTGVPQLGVDLLWGLGRGVGISFRADPVTGNWGPGVTLAVGRMQVRTSHVGHPVLGQTHRVMVGVGRPGRRSW